MTEVVETLGAPSSYRDRKYPGTMEELETALAISKTLYVGNLSFYTTEEQIYQLFSQVGEIKRIIMGLDRIKKTPCGFCFVEYYSRQDALDCMKFLNGTKLDERIIRTDIDPGFLPNRQYGRGRSGGQVRDEHREDYDQGRGGWGANYQKQSNGEYKRHKASRETYQSSYVPEGAQSSYYSSASSMGGRLGPPPSSGSRKRNQREDENGEEFGRSRYDSNPRFRRSGSQDLD